MMTILIAAVEIERKLAVELICESMAKETIYDTTNRPPCRSVVHRGRFRLALSSLI